MKSIAKILIIIFLAVSFIVVVALIGGFIFLKNLDVSKFKPQIIESAGKALGRPVDFKDIGLGVSFKNGVHLHLTDFSVGENPDFGAEAFAAVGEIDMRVDVLASVTARQIVVPSVLVRSVNLNFIRGANGLLNAQTIGQSAAVVSSTTGASAPGQREGSVTPAVPSQEQSSPASGTALPPIFIRTLKLENIKLNFIDQSVQPALKLTTQVDLAIQHFSLTSPFDVLLEAAVLSPQKNLQVDGKVQLMLLKNAARLTDVKLSADLGQIMLEDVRALPAFKGLPIPQTLKGKLTARLEEAEVSADGLEDLKLDVALAGGEIVAQDIAPGISLEASSVNFLVEDFGLDSALPFRVSLNAALYQDQPNVDFKSSVSLNLKTMAVSLTEGQFLTDFTLWPMAKIQASIAPLKSVPLPERLTGKFQSVMKELKVSKAGLEALQLDATWSDGAVTMGGLLPGKSISLDHIDLTLKNFSLTQPFYVSFKTAYLSEAPNLSFDGNVSYDLKTQEAGCKDTSFYLDFDNFSLDRFKTSGLVPEDVPFPKVLEGKLQGTIKSLAVSPKGVGRLLVDARWQNGKVVIEEAAPGISVTANRVNLAVKEFSLDKPFEVDLTLGYEHETPNISFNGQVALDPATQNIRISQAAIKTDFAQIPLSRLKTTLAPLKDVPLPEVLKGKVEVLVNELTAGPKGLLTILARAGLTGGEVRMKDIAPGVSLAATDITVDVPDFSLDKPFKFDIGLAYVHDVANIHAGGTVSLRDGDIALKDAVLETDLSTLDLDQLRAAITSLKDASLPERLRGKFSFKIAEAVVGGKGLVSLTSQGALAGWEVKLKELTVPLSGTDMKFSVTENNFTLEPALIQMGKGQFNAQGTLNDYLKTQDFNAAVEIKDLDLAEVLDQKQAPVKVQGVANGRFKARGQAANTLSIVGDGTLEVKEAKLKDLNVLKTVLDKMAFLPNVSARVEAKLPEKYKKKLQSQDTDIQQASVVCAISGGAAVLDPVIVQSEEFSIAGKGQVAISDLKYGIDGSFKIPAELSAAMTEGVEELNYLYDADNNISLPIHVTGEGAQAPVIDVTQMALDVTKGAIRNEGKRQLMKVINDAIGQDEQPAPNQPGVADDGSVSSDGQTQPQAEPAQTEKSPEEQIIDSIFNKILK